MSMRTGAAQAPKIDWRVIGVESTVNQIRNVALSILFVDLAQERAMRSAGTLGAAMLGLETAFIRAQEAALEWGANSFDSAVRTATGIEQSLEPVVKQIGALRTQWFQALSGPQGALGAQALGFKAQYDMQVMLHPGVEEAFQAAENLRIQNVSLLTAKLHLATSMLLLRENVKIAETAERLLEVQLVQTAVTVGANLAPPGFGFIGAAAGLGVGLALATGAQIAYNQQESEMLGVANQMNSMAMSMNDTTANFDDLNSQLVSVTNKLQNFGSALPSKTPSEAASDWIQHALNFGIVS